MKYVQSIIYMQYSFVLYYYIGTVLLLSLSGIISFFYMT